jgi:DNA-directed RNA polymerase specialized sigma24 family protein
MELVRSGVSDGKGVSKQAMPELLGDEEELFRRHHRSLVRAVGRVVGAPAELIEDACQNAWVALMRNQPTRTPALVGAAQSLEAAVDARVALTCLASLPEKQRHDLALLIGGFSYREIAATGERQRSLNNVNKQLTKARARLRALESAA